jgi:hypothetical protein
MKYGWEIADEVQRFASNSADMQFVPAVTYQAVVAERDVLQNNLAAFEASIRHEFKEREDKLIASREEWRLKCMRADDEIHRLRAALE